jgi:DNA-binding response OmpR family regulator
MKKITLVEDDPGIQDVIRLILNRDGYEVIVYSNGHNLLNNDFEIPDLILLDRQLSGLDGLDICRFLKQQANTKDIPVILLSANPQIGVLAKNAGADDFLEKPFNIQDLKNIVTRYITKNADIT